MRLDGESARLTNGSVQLSAQQVVIVAAVDAAAAAAVFNISRLTSRSVRASSRKWLETGCRLLCDSCLKQQN